MRSINLETIAPERGLPASSRGTAEYGQCEREVVDEAVVFDVMRSGMLNTAAGVARVALRLQFRRCGAERLVAVMLVAGLSERGAWALRRISVPVDANRPGQAARALGAILPKMLTDRHDGIALLVGADGVVRAEVLSHSGRLAWPTAIEVELRRPDRATRNRSSPV